MTANDAFILATMKNRGQSPMTVTRWDMQNIANVTGTSLKQVERTVAKRHLGKI